MTQQPDPERADQPGIDMTKPGRGGADRPPAYPPPPGTGWSGAASAPPPPPGPSNATPYQSPHQQQAHQQPWQQQGGYPPPQWQGHPGPTGSRLDSGDERMWAGAAHWGAIVAMVVAMAFLGQLIVLLVKGNDSPYVRRQAVESLNFQLTILIAGVVSGLLILLGIGLILLPLVGLAWLVFTVIGAIKASAGEDYRYPLNLRMVS